MSHPEFSDKSTGERSSRMRQFLRRALGREATRGPETMNYTRQLGAFQLDQTAYTVESCQSKTPMIIDLAGQMSLAEGGVLLLSHKINDKLTQESYGGWRHTVITPNTERVGEDPISMPSGHLDDLPLTCHEFLTPEIRANQGAYEYVADHKIQPLSRSVVSEDGQHIVVLPGTQAMYIQSAAQLDRPELEAHLSERLAAPQLDDRSLTFAKTALQVIREQPDTR